MITYYRRAADMDELVRLDEPQSGIWVHAVSPTSDELRDLSLRFALDLTLLTDATDPYEVPRFEIEDAVAYFYTRYPLGEGADTTTAPVLIAIADDAVITITNENPPFVERLTDPKAQLVTEERTRLFIRIMTAVNEAYMRRLTGIRREVQRSRASFRTIKNRDIVAFISIEQVLNESLGALLPTNDALKTILSGKYLTTREEDTDLIEDLLLQNGQLIVLAKASLKTLQNIRNAYGVIMTNRLNQTIQFLTALTIILMIPTILSSFFGMNVMLPWADRPEAFGAIVALTLILMGIFAYFFARKEWL